MPDFKVGDQVVYVPLHADNNIGHKDCEDGFVTSVSGESVWVRYFLPGSLELRTKSCSEVTWSDRLVHSPECRRKKQWLIDHMYSVYCERPE